MTPTARNVCTCAVFATSAFKFVLPTYFVLHYCYRRALYAVFYRRVFLKKVEQSCFTVVWQMTCQRSHICWCASCSHHIFVLLVQFALSAFARDYCRFPSRRVLYTSICLSIFFLRSMFAFIPLFVDFVRYLTFWHHMIQIMKYRFSRISLFTILRVVYAAMQ